MARITAPVAGFSGEIGGVVFTDGTADTENAAVISYCLAAGYEVEAEKPKPARRNNTK